MRGVSGGNDQVVRVPTREVLVWFLIKVRSKEPGDAPQESDAVLDFPEQCRVAFVAVGIGHIKSVQAEEMEGFGTGPLDDTVNVAVVAVTWGLGNDNM